MSAVSSESPRASADLTAHANGSPGAQEPPPAPPGAGQPRRAGATRGRGETHQAGRAGPAGQAGRQTPPPPTAATTDFGPNEWLVDELYQRYLADPGSVDKAWWSFFADYRPVRGGNGTGPPPGLPQ